MEKEYVYNNGVYLTRDGHAYIKKLEDEYYQEVKYITTENDYKLVPNSYLSIKDQKNPGQWLHRMIVYTFGDCNGKKYSVYKGYDVDHFDMCHFNNAVENLQFVPHGINLFRAMDRTNSQPCKDRFMEYYNSLNDIEKMILEEQIKADIRGELK